jgi:hypothetical protein
MNPNQSTALVITSIHSPNAAMKAFAAGCQEHGWDFIVAGDSKSPADFSLDGCRFLSLAAQRDSGFSLAGICPEKSYTRKNLGYLTAMRSGARVIVETDDDNHPRIEFWAPRTLAVPSRAVERKGWVNAYQYFTRDFIYPRGLPLIHARETWAAEEDESPHVCPIQQGLADHDPDVDAVYRMLFPLPFDFESDQGPVVLQNGAWCPFNSQNTTFFEDAFPLLYLPAFCSFRMTDIWRSFVAQRVMQETGRGILFHGPSVWQERNEHDLHRDFTDELSGYCHNSRIREELIGLTFRSSDSIRIMMEQCYEVLIRHGWVGQEEEQLLQSWFTDLESIKANS